MQLEPYNGINRMISIGISERVCKLGIKLRLLSLIRFFLHHNKDFVFSNNIIIINNIIDNLRCRSMSWKSIIKKILLVDTITQGLRDGLRDAPNIIRFYSSISEYPFSDAICSPRLALMLTAGCEMLSFGAKSDIVNPNSLTAQ